MDNKRPVNLNLFTIKFPIPAIASILHRISGVIIFLLLPLLLWLLHLSLTAEGHSALTNLVNVWWVKILLWATLSALIFHLIAGIRHLFMDVGYGESLIAGRITAYITIGLSIVIAILLGVAIWCIM